MTIRSKLILSFSLVASVPLVGGAIGLFAHRTASLRLEQVVQAAQQGMNASKICRDLESALAAERAAWLADRSEAKAEKRSAEIFHRAAPVAESVAALKGVAPALGVGSQMLVELESAQQQISAHAQAGTLEPADFDRALMAGQGLADAVQRGAAKILRADDPDYERLSRWCDLLMGIGTLAGVAMGGAFGVWMSLAVTRHISQIARHMWDESGKVAAAAGQVATSSRDLALASSQQAASLEETGASLTEVNGIVKTNADHAREVRTISHENRLTSDRSASEIGELQTAMQEMSAANSNISKIVQSIDEIAFQTNILALNASVEAARAGEAGAGFAVVAEEVRSLAQRSAVAARETSSKIDDALAKSRRGSDIAGRVEASLRKIIEDNRRVDTVVAQIAEACAEQAKGLDVAVNSMARIDQLTQSNAASAEQTASAAQDLDAESRALRQELSRLMGRSGEIQSEEARQSEPAEAGRGTALRSPAHSTGA